jgi:fucose 4-O-acetylase-like acetyltransferase
MENTKDWISKAFNLPLLQRNRYNWVDYLRGVVILLVVYHHAYIGIERSGINMPASVADANMVFYSFRMPLFFIISGVFTSLSLGTKPVTALIGVKFDKLFYPYIVWAFLQVSLQIILSNFTNSARDYHDYLYILYQPRQLDQFWYLPALFNATLVYIFLKSRLRLSAWLNLLLGLVFYLTAPFLNQISMISDWMRFYLFFAIGGEVLSAFIFKPAVQKQAKKPITFLLLLPFFIAAQLHYLHNNVGKRVMEVNPMSHFMVDRSHYLVYEINFLSIAFIGCATLIALSFLLERWNRLSFLRVLGYHSLYIYITHVIIVGSVRFLFTYFFHYNNPLVILLTGITLGVTIPIAFYNLLGKTTLAFLFTGKRRPKLVPVQPKLQSIETIPIQRNPMPSDIGGSIVVTSLIEPQTPPRTFDSAEHG